MNLITGLTIGRAETQHGQTESYWIAPDGLPPWAETKPGFLTIRRYSHGSFWVCQLFISDPYDMFRKHQNVTKLLTTERAIRKATHIWESMMEQKIEEALFNLNGQTWKNR